MNELRPGMPCPATQSNSGSAPNPTKLDSFTGAVGPSADIAREVVTEQEAYRLFGHLLEDKELRHARQDGRLGYLRRKRTIFYRRSELEAFLSNILDKDYIKPCQSIRPLPNAQVIASTGPAPGSRRTARDAQGVTPEIMDRAMQILAQHRR